jgi:hypothetical protein
MVLRLSIDRLSIGGAAQSCNTPAGVNAIGSDQTWSPMRNWPLATLRTATADDDSSVNFNSAFR